MGKLKYYLKKLSIWLWIDKELKFKEPDYALDIYHRAAKAQEMLENSLYLEIIETLEDDAIKIWKNTADNSKEIREFMWLYLKILNQIDLKIKSILSEVEVEKAQLEFNQKGRID